MKMTTGKIVVTSVRAGILLALGLTSMYTVGEGQAKVIRSITGEVQGQATTPGLKWKAPWQSALGYDVRNQQVIFASSKTEQDKNSNGPQITIQDREGVTANVDITVRYSIKPDAVSDIYKRYGSPESFISKFIENDIRAGVRSIPAKYGTLEFLNKRADAEAEIQAYLETRWAKHGVQAESVSLQEIRYPEEVQQRFADAQNARTEVEKAKANLEATEVNAQQKIVQAEAEAQANRTLESSLTDTILQQRYLDTLKELAAAGNLVITDGSGTDLMIQR